MKISEQFIIDELCDADNHKICDQNNIIKCINREDIIIIDGQLQLNEEIC